MLCYWLQEGSSHERGLYARCFEELFDISNSDTTSASRFDFFISVCELYNEQVLIYYEYNQLSLCALIYRNYLLVIAMFNFYFC